MSLIYTMETFILPRGFLIMHSSLLSLEKTHIFHAGSYVLEFILLLMLLSGVVIYGYLNLKRAVTPSKSSDMRKSRAPSPKVLAKIKEAAAAASAVGTASKPVVTAVKSSPSPTPSSVTRATTPTMTTTATTNTSSSSTTSTVTGCKKRTCSSTINSSSASASPQKACVASPSKKKAAPAAAGAAASVRLSNSHQPRVKSDCQRNATASEKISARSTSNTKSNENNIDVVLPGQRAVVTKTIPSLRDTCSAPQKAQTESHKHQPQPQQQQQQQQQQQHQPSPHPQRRSKGGSKNGGHKSRSRGRHRQRNQTDSSVMKISAKAASHQYVYHLDPQSVALLYLDNYSLEEETLFQRLSTFIFPYYRLAAFGFPFLLYHHPNYGVFFNSTPSVVPSSDPMYERLKQLPPNFDCLEHDLNQYFRNDDVRAGRECCRCRKKFFFSKNGQCFYHSGRLNYKYPENTWSYSCCSGDKSSAGCMSATDHVWNGLIPGVNGPFDGFVITERSTYPAYKHRVVAVDCEMCFTIAGLELTRVTLLNLRGDIVYDTLVMPENAIIDYNTPFSGITRESMEKPGATRNLAQVQQDILQLIDSDTILIGHGLENDLRALKLVHHVVIDTALIFSELAANAKYAKRCSLRNLSQWYLHRTIQDNENGHDSVEDAMACLDLVKYLVELNTTGVYRPPHIS